MKLPTVRQPRVIAEGRAPFVPRYLHASGRPAGRTNAPSCSGGDERVVVPGQFQMNKDGSFRLRKGKKIPVKRKTGRDKYAERGCRGKFYMDGGQPMILMCQDERPGKSFQVSSPREAQDLITKGCANPSSLSGYRSRRHNRRSR